jgi:hypothetical protein
MTTGLNYSDIVAQITNNSGTVFAYTSFAVTPQQINFLAANPAAPAAYVSPGDCEAGPNLVGSGGDLKQVITEHFSVTVMADSGGDMLGQNAAEQVTLYRETLRSAIAGWHPLPQTRTNQPIIAGTDNLWLYEGGARFFWIFNYSIQYQISTYDGYVPIPTPPPITIQTIITDATIYEC